LILLLLSSASLCCFLPLFFIPPVNSDLASLQWLRGGAAGASDDAGGGEEEEWWWYAEDAASVSLYFLLLLLALCLCFSLLIPFFFGFFCLFFVHSPLCLSLLAFLSFPLFSFDPLSDSPPTLSVSPLAFIVRGCMCFWDYCMKIVTVGVHHGGEGYQS